MVEIVAALIGALLFLAGVVVGHRLARGMEPVSLPSPGLTRKDSAAREPPEEQGWATREKPHVVDEVV